MAEQDKHAQERMKSFFAAIGMLGREAVTDIRREVVEKAFWGQKSDMLKPTIEAPKIGGSIHEVSKSEVTPEGLKIYLRTKVDEVRVTVPDSWKEMCADLARARGYQPEIEQGHDKDKGMDR